MEFDDVKEEIEELAAELKQRRDELRVQLHLAGADAKDGWEELEKKWGHFEAKSVQFRAEAKDAGAEIAEAAKLLGSEIKEGYERLRKLM